MHILTYITTVHFKACNTNVLQENTTHNRLCVLCVANFYKLKILNFYVMQFCEKVFFGSNLIHSWVSKIKEYCILYSVQLKKRQKDKVIYERLICRGSLCNIAQILLNECPVTLSIIRLSDLMHHSLQISDQISL